MNRPTSLLILFLCGLTLQSNTQVWWVPAADSLAMVQLYHATDGPNWTNNSNWLEPGVPVTSWFGINGSWVGDPPVWRVVSIVLNANNLNGDLPDAFHGLDAVTNLYLVNNNLTGPIPRSIRFLKSLVRFRAWGNQLTGAIPGEFGQLPSLRELYLDNNELNSIEAGVGNSQSLELLILNNNNLSWLPDELGNLSSLDLLRVHNNRLLFIPASLGRLNRVELFDNQLTELPDLTTDTPMQSLRIQRNNLKFDDVEKNLNAAGSITYNPQDSIKIYADREGNKVILSTEPLGGSDMTYRWFRDGVQVAIGKDSIYVIEDISTGGKGIYHCNVGNAATPLLTLTSHKMEVDEVPEPFIVRVLQDSLNHDAQPVRITDFQIGQLDLSNVESPIRMIDTQFSDENGLLRLRPPFFQPETPFIIRTRLHRQSAVKGNRHDLDGFMFTLYADNLIIDEDGNVHAQTLPASVADTIDLYLTRTSFGYNLLVSVEWPADNAYVRGLENAFRRASNLLLDISNGQAYFEKVAVYDDKRFWNDADVRIHASNGQWPSAEVYGIRERDAFINMPPKHFGEKWTNVIRSFTDLLLIPDNQPHIEMLVHEFGHYGFGFYDEYQDRDKKRIHHFTNFGFMDGWPKASEMQTEMSAFDDLAYRDTEQYQRRGMTCWDFWEQATKPLLGSFPGVRPQLYTPRNLGFTANRIIRGPNWNLSNPDFSVGDMMEFIDKTPDQNIDRVRVRITNDSGNPAERVQVMIRKQRKRNGYRQTIDQGSTDYRGRIALLGAEIGDEIHIFSADSEQWKYHSTLLGAMENNNLLKPFDDDYTFELHTVSGVDPFFTSIRFDGGGTPVFELVTVESFPSAPVLTLYADDLDSDESQTTISAVGYEVALDDDIPGSSILSLRMVDSGEVEFEVPQTLRLYTVDSLQSGGFDIGTSDGQFRLEIQSGIAEGDRIAVLGSEFPAPRNGIDASFIRVSAVFALDIYPASGELDGHLFIYFFADSLVPAEEDALVIHRWENGQWTPLPTTFHSELSKSATPDVEPGLYAAFLDPGKSTVTKVRDNTPLALPREYELHQNYPNPFNPATTIRYVLPEKKHVVLTVYNILGQIVARLVDDEMEAGVHEIAFDGYGLASGVFVYHLQAGDFVEAKKFVLVK